MSKFIALSLTLTSSCFILANHPVIDTTELILKKITSLTESQLEPIVKFLDEQEIGCNWIKEYHLVTNLIKNNNLKVGCEIGVAYGLQSKYILENTEVEKLYSIDPYLHRDGYNDFMNFPQEHFELLYYKVSKRLSEFGTRNELIRKMSTDAAKLFSDSILDFVYIDADHSYEAVSADLKSWYSKVRSGGLLIGDDYVVFTSTKKAVDEFIKNNNLVLFTQGNKWWIIKP